MFERLKARILFHRMLKRPDIRKAYRIRGPKDPWLDTLTKVHNALAEIRQLPHEEVSITSHDKLTLRGLFYPGHSDITVIWVHGYTSHAERESAFPGLFYHSLGYNVLIPYLRAHGPSEGRYLTFGALEHADMREWVRWVNQRYPNGKIMLHGLSMGGGIVLFLSNEEMENVKCLIADAPSHSIDGFLYGVSESVYPKSADAIYTHAKQWFLNTFGVDPSLFDCRKTVPHCRYPLLLSAGSKEQMEDLFAKLKQCNPMPTETIILPGCDHGNGMYKQTELYQGTIREFLNRHL